MLNVVLYEPLIPQNTGNIMRTCVATNAKLYLIKPLGFSLDDKYLKRARLDYISKLDYKIYDNWDDFLSKNKGEFYFFSRYAKKSYHKISYNKNKKTYIIFGKETTGIDKNILINNLNNTYRIPTSDNVRSLNLSNAVAIISYNYLEKIGFPDLYFNEPEKYKGKNYLLKYKKIKNKGEK